YRVRAQVSDEALAILTKANGLLKELGVQNLQELAKLKSDFRSPEQKQRHLRTVALLDAECAKLQHEFDVHGVSPHERNDPWVSIDRVRRALPSDGVLVEIIEFCQLDFKANAWKPAHYVAWLIPPAGEKKVQVIDLGDAATIEKAVAEVRKALAAAAQSIQQRGEADAEKEVLAALR